MRDYPEEARQRLRGALGHEWALDRPEFNEQKATANAEVLRVTVEGLTALLVAKGICTAAEAEAAIMGALNASAEAIEQANAQRPNPYGQMRWR